MRSKEYSGGYEKQRITNLVATALPCSVEPSEQRRSGKYSSHQREGWHGFPEGHPDCERFQICQLGWRGVWKEKV